MSSSPTDTPRPLDADATATVDELASAAIGGGVTGVIVAVHDPTRGDLLKAYGTADRSGTPMTTDLHFRIASVTKTFTAQAILQLADDGKLSLDDPISSYVEGIPNGRTISLRDLLAMRSGLFDYVTDPTILGAYREDPLMPDFTLEQALRSIRAHTRQTSAPDTRTVYSNTNFLLLGLVIEKVTGQRAADYLDQVAEHLGLRHTTFPTTPELPKPYARGYLPSPDDDVDVTRSSVLFPWTAGATVSTVPDMLTYAEAMGTGTGLTPTTFSLRRHFHPLTESGVRVGYGLGLLQFGDWIGHNGSIDGYSDFVAYLPSAKASVVVMGNAADSIDVPSTELFAKVVQALYPGSLPSV